MTANKIWLSVSEAAARMGVCPATVKQWCNHLDADSGEHSPKVEHIRVGTRGRPNRRNGLRGTIKIHVDTVKGFVEARTYSPAEAVSIERSKPVKRPYKPIHF